jgi:RimJ/RimL family protein N-acetyltransferase
MRKAPLKLAPKFEGRYRPPSKTIAYILRKSLGAEQARSARFTMIETGRLRLRPHQVQDFNRYLPLWVLPEPPGTHAPMQLTPEEVWARLLRFVGHWSHFGYGLFVVEERGSGDIVAEVGLAHFMRGIGPAFDAAPEAAWRVLATRRGAGIAGEAMAGALAWFDRAIRTERTVCLIYAGHERSIRVATRLGYRPFGQCEFKGQSASLFERMAS